MSIFTSRPALRWGVPAVVFVAVIGGGAAARTLTASADPSLSPRTAAQLLVDLQTARLDGVSGTVVEQADLGLPSLPGIGGQGSSDLTALASGSHTVRVWYAGPHQARIALIGTLGEKDVITNGHDVWQWDSKTNTATHSVLPAEGTDNNAKRPAVDPNNLPKTPQEAANLALAAISPSTTVTTSGSDRVAGRPAYELKLQPRDTSSLIGQVTVSIDAVKHVPLRVRVVPAKSLKPAFQVEFTQVSFTRPDASQFTFSPPKGAKVEEQSAPDKSQAGTKPDTTKPDTGTQQRPTIVGQGWTSVVVAKLPADALTPATSGDQQRGPSALDILGKLPRVSGSWGSGHLLTSRLVSVLVTDDGRVIAGAVSPDRLYQAAAAK